MLFFRYSWPSCTRSSVCLNTGDKLTVISSVTREVLHVLALRLHFLSFAGITFKYIRLKSGLVTSSLVVENGFFKIKIGGWKDFMLSYDKFPGFGHRFNISKIRLLIQVILCRNARIQMDISKKNRFLAEKAVSYFPSHWIKVPVSEMIESTGFFFSPMLPIFLWKLKIIAYRGGFTISSSSRLELLCQCEMTA